MKLRFKHQKFQEDACNATCDVFSGQPNKAKSISVSIPGVQKGVVGIKPKQGKMCKHGQRGQCLVPKCENFIDSSTNR